MAQSNVESKFEQATLGSWLHDLENMAGFGDLEKLLTDTQGWDRETPLEEIASAGKEFIVRMFEKSNVKGVFLTRLIKHLNSYWQSGSKIHKCKNGMCRKRYISQDSILFFSLLFSFFLFVFLQPFCVFLLCFLQLTRMIIYWIMLEYYICDIRI